MEPKKWSWFRIVIVAPLALFAIITFNLSGGEYRLMGIIVTIIFGNAFIIADQINWRCPHCRKYLGKYSTGNCGRCGAKVF